MKFIKIQAGTKIFAVVESVDLGYKLCSLHGCKSAADKAIKRYDKAEIAFKKTLGHYEEKRYSSPFYVQEFTFEELFRNF